jgi:hypothetical protein
MDITSAHNAREQVLTIKTERANVELVKVNEAILEAISAEKFSINLPYSISETVTARLRMLGYSVSFTSHRNEPTTSISWKEEDA